jgi:dihydropteroate synthase
MPLHLADILDSHRTGRTIVMGILNVTPDSFSDGGAFLAPDVAARHAEAMIAEGADIIDVGAESTRPGSDRVQAAQQLARLQEILPAVCNAAQNAGALVSIDTTRCAVADFALQAGASIINDVSAGREDPDLLALAAEASAPLVLMHMLGEPKTMQAQPQYDDVCRDVADFLARRLDAVEAAGVSRRHCIVDPGIGFGKTREHNLALIAGLGVLGELDRPILLGPSRKRFIGEVTADATGRDAPPPPQRLGGTLSACLAGRRSGAAIFRVHDVAPLVQALAVEAAIETSRPR